MEIIGVLGGMSWPSTLEYYRLMNEAAARRLGPDRSAEVLLYSLDWGRIERLQHAGDWDALAEELITGARRLVLGGAGFLVIATNTMHKVAAAVEAVSGLEVLHIADATAQAVRRAGVKTVGLLGTRFTMEEPFLREKLAGWGLEVIVPGPEDREAVHRIIYEELVGGVVREASRAVYRGAIERLVQRGAEGIVLGCTEIGLLIGEDDAPVPVFDTTRIHAEAAVARALGG